MNATITAVEASTEPASLPMELPVLGAQERERADAVRNRRRIVAAAERLFTERGIEHVSMEAIAAEAGVGKGTLFRRFGDRASLARTLLGEREVIFQEALIRGPAPLGPGAEPVDRLVAFGGALLELLEDHGDLVLAAETGAPGRCNSSPYAVYRTHVALLVREADPGLDADYVADALLASLSAELFLYLRRDRDMSIERIRAGYAALVHRLIGADRLSSSAPG